MRTEINKIIILLYGIALLGCSIIKAESIPSRMERQKLLSKEVEMQLPTPFHTQKDNYEEGVIYFYSFVDSAYIIVFQGSMMEFPIDKYQPKKTEVKNQKTISVGIENDKYW